jgi:serine phosphatase RsbU (regulator of sigma subunit)
VSLSFREYGFIALTLLAGVWFFVGYPSQDPRTVIDDMKLDHNTAEHKAQQVFDGWGYPLQRFKGITSFSADRVLVDTLQKFLGRAKMVDTLAAADFSNIVPFYWETTFRPIGNGEGVVDGQGDQQNSTYEDALTVRLDADGNPIELVNQSNKEPLEVVNRAAIAAIFDLPRDSALTFLSSYDDATIATHLNIDLQSSWNRSDYTETNRSDDLINALEENKEFRLIKQDFYSMASFYLEQTGWDLAKLKPDTVEISREDSHNFATATFSSHKATLGVNLSVDVGLTPTGGLLSIKSNYGNSVTDDNGDGIWSFARTSIIILFGLAVVIIFFFRIRERAIDTKPALVVSIMCGLAVSVVVSLLIFSSSEFLMENGEWTQRAIAFVGAGLSGAGTALAFFILFSVGDSVTRQYWPQKLDTYDYLRQGMLFNKPVGFMLVSSVALAFVLAGLWTLLLWIFPDVWISFEKVFVHEYTLWPPAYITLTDAVYSLAIVLSVFVILGAQTFGQSGSKLFSGAVMIIGSGIAVPVSGSYGPAGLEFMLSMLLGLGMVWIYLQWDFLTLLLSHFLFLGLLDTALGWSITGSPDTYLFMLLLVLMSLFLGIGFTALVKGKKENLLTRYVPEYVEELAQEERIKQELQIAREVQQSFLPIQKPQFKELDLAALCKPAYETGGDYYDFIQLDDHRLAVTIGDVSGKGFQAAFYMTFIKGILQSLCHEIDSPAEVMKRVNRLFYDNAQRGTFISLVYGIIDLKKRTFRFARAGHNPILRVHGNNSHLEELKPKGIGIGLSKDRFDEHLEEVELSLEDNNVLVLYTDGIVEALSEAQNFYGTDRLHKSIKRNVRKSAKEILDQLAQDVRSFIGKTKQHDDMTMMVMKLKDQKEN